LPFNGLGHESPPRVIMTTKLRLDIPVLLPDVEDANDVCVRRLIDEIGTQAGVVNVHVRPPRGAGVSQLCVHYDTAQLPFGRIREIVTAAGAKVSERYAHVVW
ncbi:hypothetical protein ABTF44_20280, partial [Acinetobacter baumannii]